LNFVDVERRRKSHSSAAICQRSRCYSQCGPSQPKEESVQYVLLIYQGSAWASLPHLSEEKKSIGADYAALNETPGVTPGLPLGLPEDATTVRVEDGKTMSTKGPSSPPRERSAATSYARPTISIPPSRSRRGSLRRVLVAQSRYAPSERIGSES